MKLQDQSKYEDKYVVAAGIKTRYIEVGKGPALVMVHGAGAGADAWGNFGNIFDAYAANFRTIALDMVGFGKTEKPDPKGYAYTQENRNKQLIDFLDKVVKGPAHLIGNSIGGATSLGAAMARPDLVNKIVLMGSAGLRGADQQQPSAAYKALVNYDFTKEGMRRVVDALCGSRFRVDDATIEYRHKLAVEPAGRAALTAINDEIKKGTMIYAEDAIRAIKAPVLVVNGKEDQISTIGRAMKFLELLDNSFGYIVPHCGHWVMLEYPEDFCSETSRFLLATHH